ncbi:hypothetical protein NA57DRAFT_52514 [Rhizodiscina lignyota]|uniref:Uncharacterized protein n=1 Tax=Rhizodiscina lignyota TaxID=1504668 RepID=A0A9P4IRK5_9PEZI|nr:hypothetical protein NA57DRAFT_52514 [Rhizodiscina lignyota]
MLSRACATFTSTTAPLAKATDPPTTSKSSASTSKPADPPTTSAITTSTTSSTVSLTWGPFWNSTATPATHNGEDCGAFPTASGGPSSTCSSGQTFDGGATTISPRGFWLVSFMFGLATFVINNRLD